MNYNKLYSRFLESRPLRTKQKNDGLERHHILPRSLGGTNTADNLIALTAREHWIAHRLLSYCYIGERRAKMIYALIRLSGGTSHRIPGRVYARLRQAVGRLHSRAMKKTWQDPNYIAKFKKGQARTIRLRKQPGEYREQWIDSIRQAKKKQGKRTAKHTSSVWQSLTSEQRAERGRRISEAKKRGWATRDETYRQQWRERLRQGHASIPAYIKRQQIERMLASKYDK